MNNRELAKRIVADLFTAGNGQKGERLVCWLDSEQRSLGGWSEGPASDRVQKILDEVLDKDKRGSIEP